MTRALLLLVLAAGGCCHAGEHPSSTPAGCLYSGLCAPDDDAGGAP